MEHGGLSFYQEWWANWNFDDDAATRACWRTSLLFVLSFPLLLCYRRDVFYINSKAGTEQPREREKEIVSTLSLSRFSDHSAYFLGSHREGRQEHWMRDPRRWLRSCEENKSLLADLGRNNCKNLLSSRGCASNKGKISSVFLFFTQLEERFWIEADSCRLQRSTLIHNYAHALSAQPLHEYLTVRTDVK